jgi:hypothetical protein
MAVQAFRAVIRIDRSNPYVDIPARVSRAFAGSARGGRIHVVGKLGRTPIRATLTPVGGGGHRLYVNGGMRAAAGVGVGDTARFALRATGADEVPLPADLSAKLRRTPRARAAFNSMAASHRRELLRYVDDARTPDARRKRIDGAIRYALGQEPAKSARGSDRPLWECPRCGHRFVTRNMNHSCKRHSLGDCFRGKPAEIRALFDRFREVIEACGPVTAVAYGDHVGFMVKVRFAGAWPRSRWLDVGFWLPRRIESPRFRKIETILINAHVHRLRVTKPEDLDVELAGWIREAYRIGCREHLAPPGAAAPPR